MSLRLIRSQLPACSGAVISHTASRKGSSGGTNWLMIGVAVGVAVILIALVALAVLRGNRLAKIVDSMRRMQNREEAADVQYIVHNAEDDDDAVQLGERFGK